MRERERERERDEMDMVIACAIVRSAFTTRKIIGSG